MTLQRELGRLVEAELVYQKGVPPQSTYVFKHALIQDAAYQSLLKSTRQQYHQRIAQVLEAQFPELPCSISSVARCVAPKNAPHPPYASRRTRVFPTGSDLPPWK
jgi:hypothetical protein